MGPGLAKTFKRKQFCLGELRRPRHIRCSVAVQAWVESGSLDWVEVFVMTGKYVRNSLIALVLLVLVACVPCASAQTTWNLTDVTFSGGGSATGSFTYNAGTNAFSSIDITVTGSPFGNGTYLALDPGFGSTSTLMVAVPNGSLADFTGTPLVALNFGTGLTGAGGTIPLLTGTYGLQQCENSTCGYSVTIYAVNGGEVTTSSVPPTPEPPSFSLFILGAGVLCLAAMFRR